jgi:hypothetical protein
MIQDELWAKTLHLQTKRGDTPYSTYSVIVVVGDALTFLPWTHYYFSRKPVTLDLLLSMFSWWQNIYAEPILYNFRVGYITCVAKGISCGEERNVSG